MKNIFKTLAAFAVIALAVACSKDGAEAPAVGEKATVSFDVQLPGGLASRATNDGTTAQQLFYAVYSDIANDAAPLFTGETTINITATVSIDLVTDQVYDIVFWAQKEGKYTPDWNAKTIAMNYANGAAGADEERDAFLYVWHDLEVKGAVNEPVTLKRPFAQLNVGLTKEQITKAANAGFELESVKVTAQTHNSFSFAAAQGAPADELATIEFAASAFEAPVNADGKHEITVEGTTYDWVSFNYLLACTPSELTNVEIVFNGKNGKTIALPAFASVPVERNHRTNIVGDLLTDPANFNVTIDPVFDEEDYVVDEPTNAAVNTAEELKAALKNSALEMIILADGVYEGVFVADSYDQTIVAANAGQATIKGKFAAAYKNIAFRGLNFEVSADTSSKTGNQYLDKANSYIIPIYCANVTVENCSFKGMTDDLGAIYYYANTSASTTPEKLTVKNTTFDGGRAIRSRANLSVTDCQFFNLLNPCVGLLGFGNSSIASNVVFTNNTSDTFIEGIELKTTNYTLENIDFNVGGNINCNIIAYDSKNLNNLKEDTFTYSGEVKEIVPMNSIAGASNEEELADAIANLEDGGTVIISEGATVQLPDVKDKTITFVGAGDGAFLEMTDDIAHNDTNYQGAELYFENLTIVGASYDGKHNGYVQSAKEVYKKCTFYNYYMFAGDEVLVEECDFINKGQYFWTGSADVITFNKCQFTGKDRAIKVCCVGNATSTARNVYVKECSFTAETANKAVLEIDNSSCPYKVYVSDNSTKNDVYPAWFNCKYSNTENSILVTIDGKSYVSDNAGVTEAAKTANATVVIADNATVTLPTSVANGVTFEGGEGSVLDMSNVNGSHFDGVNFKNLTIKESNDNYNGIQHSDNLKYENCVLEGQHFLYATNIEFTDCDFEQTGNAYNVWTYGATNITFTGCKFHSTKGKSLLIFQDGSNNDCVVNVDTCTFTGDAAAQTWNGIDITAMDIDSTAGTYQLNIKNTKVTGYAVGSVSGNNIWNHKAGNGAVTVSIDGSQVYTNL